MANHDSRNNSTTAKARRSRFYRGVQVAVARSLGKSRGHVCLVARGQRTSRAVLEALATAVERFEREHRKVAA